MCVLFLRCYRERCRYSVCKTDGSSFLLALKQVQLCTVQYVRASVASVNRNGSVRYVAYDNKYTLYVRVDMG